MEVKTSKDWSEDFPDVMILDPDGWDQTNFDYSFFEEKITKEEFIERMKKSTITGLHLAPFTIDRGDA